MKHRTRPKSSSLFLLELIIAILFFAIASTVCVQLFVKSHNMSNDAQLLNTMVSECSAAAEIIYSSEDIGEATDLIPEQFNGVELSAGEERMGMTWFYDKNLQPCLPDEGVYAITVSMYTEGRLMKADINATGVQENKAIYALEVQKAMQKEAE